MSLQLPKEILPKMDIDKEPGFMVPGYDFQAAVKPPASIGVRRSDTMGSVIDAVRGVAYYTDVIGFGEASNKFTKSLPAEQQPMPIGINYFLKTNMKCPNKEFMYRYIRGITQGNALGEYVKQSLKDVGLPGLRGLAPGMIEDVKEGLDPTDLFRAAFGNAYPDCVFVELPVGDYSGNIKNPNYMKDGEMITGETYITGETFEKNGRPHQRRWVQKEDARGNPIYLTKEQYDRTAIVAAEVRKKYDTTEDYERAALVAEEAKKNKQGFADYVDERSVQTYTRVFGATLICAGLFYHYSK